MARPGGPVTTRQVPLHVGALPASPTPAAARHRLYDFLNDLGRSRITSDSARAVTARDLDRLHGRKAGRTALHLPANRLSSAAADPVETCGAPVRHLLDSEVIPDAVIAVSDPLAVGVHRAVRRRGLRPGTDVAVTGLDDSPPASAVDGAPIPVRQPVDRSAHTVANLLDLALLDHAHLTATSTSTTAPPHHRTGITAPPAPPAIRAYRCPARSSAVAAPRSA
ncbi:substrate-binding domain-containing protein [Actinosynnema sp. NPDC051121]|nr:substrate-binding domain-containing protein [Saccharothrix sp.]